MKLTDNQIQRINISIRDIMRNPSIISDTGISPEDRIQDKLGLDSLDIIEIAMAIEDVLLVDISDELIERWEVVQDIYDSAEKSL